jgi:hypothetical protein
MNTNLLNWLSFNSSALKKLKLSHHLISTKKVPKINPIQFHSTELRVSQRKNASIKLMLTYFNVTI